MLSVVAQRMILTPLVQRRQRLVLTAVVPAAVASAPAPSAFTSCRRTLANDTAFVDDDDAMRERVSFFQVVRREQDGLAARRQ